MFVLLFILITLVMLLLIINFIQSKLYAIFRHDIANDVQLIKGYLILNKRKLTDESIINIQEKLKTFTNVNNSSFIFQLLFLFLYSEVQKKASCFDIFVNAQMKNYNLSMFKSLLRAIIYIRKLRFNKIEIDIDKDLVEIFYDGYSKSF
ncbi:hypothetical protein PRVXT_001765 [Proteinivorax tanatarense]|uniref:SpoOB alpha-helical domain-containing protein n=1 Tax=Proteinivorax tanatarense TaxID=1260629 RepID=A0AAU7VI71_9FIRM